MHAGRLFLLLCALCAVGAEPVYLGCSWRILGPFLSGDAIVTSQNVSVDFCEDFCLHKADGAPHLAAALRGGDECNCYNTLSVFTFPPGISCAKTCAGNPDQMCGGSRTLSVYQVSFPQAPPQPGTTELPATEADTQMPQGLPTGVPATGVPATMAPATGMPPTMMPMTDAAPTSPPTLAPEASNETVASETWLPVPHTAMPVPSGTAVPPTPQTWHTATPVLQTDTRSTPLPLPEASPTPALPNSEALGEQQAAAVALMAAVGGSLPGAASGTKMGFLALSTRAMLCPGDGPDHLDCTLSPLGLSMGHTAFREHNGGVVGALVLHFGLLGLCSIVAALLYLCYRRDMRQNHDLQYIMMQARFGWLIVPFTFLYGGTVLCAVTCVVYSTASYKVPAVVVLAVVGLGFPYYTFMVAHHCPEYQTYDSAHLTDRSSWWKVVLLGPAEWQDKDVEGSEAWSCLHRPVYNGYRYQMRYFLCVELMFMLVLACFTAWQPGSRHECWWRSLGMTSVAATFFLLLVVFRPFVALYENILEALIAGGETAMLVFTMVALDSGADSAADHWAAGVAADIALSVVYAVVVKLGLEIVTFAIDATRKRAGRSAGSLCCRWLCFSGLLREMDEHFRGQALPTPEECAVSDLQMGTEVGLDMVSHTSTAVARPSFVLVRSSTDIETRGSCSVSVRSSDELPQTHLAHPLLHDPLSRASETLSAPRTPRTHRFRRAHRLSI